MGNEPDWETFFAEKKGAEVTLFLRFDFTAGATQTEIHGAPDAPPTQIERRATIDGKVEESGVKGIVAVRQTITQEMSAAIGVAPGSFVTFIPHAGISHVGVQSALSVVG